MSIIALLLLMLGLVDQSNQENENSSGEDQEEWVLVQPPQLGATIEMPSVPELIVNRIKPVRDRDEIIVRFRSSIVDKGETNFTFVYHEEPVPPRGRDQIKAVLDGAVSGAIAQLNGNLIHQEEVFVGRYKGRDFVYEAEIDDARMQTTHELRVRSRVVLVGSYLMSMNYITVKDRFDDNLAEKFFGSLKLVKQPDDLPPAPRPGRARALVEGNQ